MQTSDLTGSVTLISQKSMSMYSQDSYTAETAESRWEPRLRRKKDWQYSKYTCPTRRKLASACNGKFTSDPIVGEFVFNYVLNMLNVQKNFADIHSPEELQVALLIGNTFSYIDHIDEDGLNDLFNMLSSGKIKGTVFGKSAKLKRKRLSPNYRGCEMKSRKSREP